MASFDQAFANYEKKKMAQPTQQGSASSSSQPIQSTGDSFDSAYQKSLNTLGNKIIDLKAKGQDTSEQEQAYQSISGSPFSVQQHVAPQSPGIFSRIGSDIKKTASNIGKNISEHGVMSNLLGEGALRTVGEVGYGAANIVAEPINSITSTLGDYFGPKITDWAKSHPEAAKNLAATLQPTVEGGTKAIQKTSETYNKAFENYPEAKKNVEAVGGIIAGLGAIETAGAAKSALKTGITKVAQTEAGKAIEKNLAKRSVSSLDEVIDRGIEKGVRPSVSGKAGSATQTRVFKEKARDAVKTIAEHTDQLSLVDQFGDITVGPPKSLKQFSDAIEQTKKIIFKKYDDLARSAGEKGVTLSLENPAAELEKVAKSKAIRTVKPEIADYAEKTASRLRAAKTFTPEEAQDAIKIYNQSLDAFYKNPSADTASKAYLDSLVVNHMRSDLDNLIEGAAGKNYGELKRQYGSLKSLEKDVAHRALVEGRKAPHGLIDFTDVFSGSQAIEGILSLNPAKVGSALTQKAIATWIKNRNSPNKIIENMFNDVYKTMGKASKTGVPFRKP